MEKWRVPADTRSLAMYETKPRARAPRLRGARNERKKCKDEGERCRNREQTGRKAGKTRRSFYISSEMIYLSTLWQHHQDKKPPPVWAKQTNQLLSDGGDVWFELIDKGLLSILRRHTYQNQHSITCLLHETWCKYCSVLKTVTNIYSRCSSLYCGNAFSKLQAAAELLCS